jgi:opacity protein-like surface antigen
MLTIGLGGVAQAADMRVFAPNGLVPGTPSYWDWSGFYVGGQAGVASGTFDPGKATNSMVAHILRLTTLEAEARVSTWSQLPKTTNSGSTFGGFFGYNSQWDDVILSVEFQYNSAALSGQSSDTIGRSFLASDGYLYNVDVSSRSSIAMKDYAGIRGRAGYVMGRWLPYAQFGFIVGRADIFRSTTVAATGRDVTRDPPFPNVALGPVTATEYKKDAFMYGLSAGVGLDFAITENLFLRGEYEYALFFPTSGIKFNMNTGRVGVAMKF